MTYSLQAIAFPVRCNYGYILVRFLKGFALIEIIPHSPLENFMLFL